MWILKCLLRRFDIVIRILELVYILDTSTNVYLNRAGNIKEIWIKRLEASTPEEAKANNFLYRILFIKTESRLSLHFYISIIQSYWLLLRTIFFFDKIISEMVNHMKLM